MAFPQGINFRGTSGYATDGANEDKSLNATADYPRTTAQGNTVGWEDAPTLSFDRDNSVNDRVRGAAFTDHSTLIRFRIDLSASGDWKVRLAMGDVAGASSQHYAELFDTTTSLGVLANKSSTGSNITNESNVLDTPANWASAYSSSGVTKTFSTTICRIKIGNTSMSGWCPMAHFYVESVGAAGITATLSATLGALTSSSAAANAIAAASSKTLDTLSSSSAAANSVAAALATSLGALTGTSAAANQISASVGAALASLSLSSGSTNAGSGALSATLGEALLSSAASNLSHATLSATLDALSLSADANSGAPRSAALAQTLASLSSSITALVSQPPSAEQPGGGQPSRRSRSNVYYPFRITPSFVGVGENITSRRAELSATLEDVSLIAVARMGESAAQRRRRRILTVLTR